MDQVTYRAKLKELEAVDWTNLESLGRWTETTALPWLWDEMRGVLLTRRPKHPRAANQPTPKRMRPLSYPQAVRHGLMTSASDQTKAKSLGFFHAQLTMLDSEAKRYCDHIETLSGYSHIFASDAVAHTLHRALQDMMRLAIVLLEDAGREVAGVCGYYGAWRRQHETSFEIFKGTEQIIYGTYSGLTHTDRAPYIPVAALRTAIELRLRHAFCISGLVDQSRPNELIPIDLSKLFGAIQKHQEEIEFAVDIHDVWKVYRWSNFYLHGGFRDYPWVPGFLLQYLRPFFSGPPQMPARGWSLNAGVKMSRKTWHAVRKELDPRVQGNSFFQRLSAAYRILRSGRNSRLHLPEADQQSAHCVYDNED